MTPNGYPTDCEEERQAQLAELAVLARVYRREHPELSQREAIVLARACLREDADDPCMGARRRA